MEINSRCAVFIFRAAPERRTRTRTHPAGRARDLEMKSEKEINYSEDPFFGRNVAISPLSPDPIPDTAAIGESRTRESRGATRSADNNN